MNIINEFDVYQKMHIDNAEITNIKVDVFSDKYSLSIKENKNDTWTDVLNQKDQSLFFSKPHLFKLLKSLDLPQKNLSMLEDVNTGGSFEFANGIENQKEEKSITSFLENSNYIHFLKMDDINKGLKKVFTNLKGKASSKMGEFEISREDKSIMIKLPALNGGSIKIDFEGDSVFQMKAKKFYVINKTGEEILSTNSQRFPLEKSIVNDFLKMSNYSPSNNKSLKF